MPTTPADTTDAVTKRGELDPVAELRLRRWARTHHVPRVARDPRWHPVVWDEMAARDRDLARRGRLTVPA